MDFSRTSDATQPRLRNYMLPTNRLEPPNMSDGPFDPRIICNLMLDEADRDRVVVTNLALQKLLYFAHSRHLVETKRPLVSGYFLRRGSTVPSTPPRTKPSNPQAISPSPFGRSAKTRFTGRRTPLPRPTDASAVQAVRGVMASYGRFTPGRLVEISHAKEAPWAYVVDQARTKMAFGLRIGDNVILERFKFHKVSVGAAPLAGEPFEDTPFT